MLDFFCDKCGEYVDHGDNDKLRGDLIGGIGYIIEMSFTKPLNSNPYGRPCRPNFVYRNLCQTCMVELLTSIIKNEAQHIRKCVCQDSID